MCIRENLYLPTFVMIVYSLLVNSLQEIVQTLLYLALIESDNGCFAVMTSIFFL